MRRTGGRPPGYTDMHKKVSWTRGTPRLCSHCHSTVAKRYEWALKPGGNYWNIWDYDRLCRSCHCRRDMIPAKRTPE